jgi:hypothetical protein
MLCNSRGNLLLTTGSLSPTPRFDTLGAMASEAICPTLAGRYCSPNGNDAIQNVTGENRDVSIDLQAPSSVLETATN